MTDLRDSLDALVAELRRLGSDIGAYLQPGLPPEAIQGAVSAAGARPHEDVVTLFAWRNGTDIERLAADGKIDLSLTPSRRDFYPLDRTIDEFRLRIDSARRAAARPMRGSDGEFHAQDPDTIWSPAWFPILFGEGSESIYIRSDGEPGSVWFDAVHDPPRRLFDSLADAVDALRSGLANGRIMQNSGVFVRPSQVPSDLLSVYTL